MKNLRQTLLVLGSALLLAAPASAQEASRMEGFSLRALIGAGGETAMLYGAEGYSFRSGSFYMGGAGAGGPFLDASKGALGYGGLIVGSASKLVGETTYDLRLLFGGGGGALNGNAGGGVVLEPSLSLGFALDGGWNPSLTAGYLYMQGLPELSGPTVGLRLNFPAK